MKIRIREVEQIAFVKMLNSDTTCTERATNLNIQYKQARFHLIVYSINGSLDIFMVSVSIFSSNAHSCVQNILSVLQKKSHLILLRKNEALLLDQVAPEIMWICWLWKPVLTFFRAKLFTLKVLVLMLALLQNNFGTLKFQCVLNCEIMWMFEKIWDYMMTMF